MTTAAGQRPSHIILLENLDHRAGIYGCFVRRLPLPLRVNVSDTGVSARAHTVDDETRCDVEKIRLYRDNIINAREFVSRGFVFFFQPLRENPQDRKHGPRPHNVTEQRVFRSNQYVQLFSLSCFSTP